MSHVNVHNNFYEKDLSGIVMIPKVTVQEI